MTDELDPEAEHLRSGDRSSRDAVHDLRNALHALATGLELLAHVREDERLFTETVTRMRGEHQQARDLLEQLARMLRDSE